MKSKSKETLAIVGLGYVGLPLALLAARKGYKVFGIDIDADKVHNINNGTGPFLDSHLEDQAEKDIITATTDFNVIKQAAVVVICVPTPVYENHMPNLEPVRVAVQGVGSHLQKGQLVIIESTINPAVTETVILPLLEIYSGLKGGKDFSLAHCPERINPGDLKWNVENIPRVVGGFDAISLGRAKDFYESILSGAITSMGSLKEAEAVKIVENAFRDINIAFVNELAMSFSKLGIDVMNVIKGAGTKPFAFIPHYPGCGVGGHCIPVDPYYLIEFAKENGFHHRFLELARKINEEMPKFTVDQVIRGLNEKQLSISGSNIAVLGIAYKADIDDYRESPSFEIIEQLKEYGAEVRVYDPFVEKFSTTGSMEEALKGAQAVVLVTNHKVFRELTPRDLLNQGISVIIDGRNCLPKDDFVTAGLTYKGIGR